MPPLALVTGATSGIGKAFAERLAADGFDLIITGRRADRLDELAGKLTASAGVTVRAVPADLSTDAGIIDLAEIARTEPLTMLVNNAGVAHYMPLNELPVAKAHELTQVKVVAPTMLTHAAVPGMLDRAEGTIVTVAGMIAFSGPGEAAAPAGRRAIYTGTLAYGVAMTQSLNAELAGTGVSAHVVCPGIVATEFHSVQGMDLSQVPRMTPEQVVEGALAGIRLGEVVSAPGVEDYSLLDSVFTADLAAFHGQSPKLASRYSA